MPHVSLPEGEPGIVGLMVAFRESEKPLNALAQVVMCGPSSLSRAERELIATFVSSRNQCEYCTNSHAAATRKLLGESHGLMDEALADPDSPCLDEKMRSLLVIADKVRQDGRLVAEGDVQRARAAGANDRAIHDTVLIAAMFCMFNRYVDGLGTFAPKDQAYYDAVGERIASLGYGSRFREAACPTS